MRRHGHFYGQPRALLLALIASVAAAAHADDPSLQGTFLNEQQSAQTIETAIEAAVAKMNFIKRPIARSRLKKTNEAHRRVEIGVGRDEKGGGRHASQRFQRRRRWALETERRAAKESKKPRSCERAMALAALVRGACGTHHAPACRVQDAG